MAQTGLTIRCGYGGWRLALRLLISLSLWISFTGAGLAQEPWRVWHPDLEPPWPKFTKRVQSPNGRFTVFCRYDLVADRRVPLGGVVVSTAYLVEGSDGTPRPIHRTQRTPQGVLLSPDRRPQADSNLSQFLIVSWSPDSRLALFAEVLGYRDSDVFSAIPWVYEVAPSRVRYIPMTALYTRVLRHWLAKGENLSGKSYEATLLGWERGSASRIAFQAFTLWDPPGLFLGYWSTDLQGGEIRLLSEKEEGYTADSFGIVAGGR